MDTMNEAILDSRLTDKMLAIAGTLSIWCGAAKKSVLDFGHIRIPGMLRAWLLSWLNKVYQVKRFLLARSRGAGALHAGLTHVYDILNAGPEHRFSTAQFIVSNCGYGMGWERFVSYAAERGVTVTDKEAKDVISAFRTSNKSIVKLWRKMDAVIRQAAVNKSRSFELEMPTGDLLKYFAVRSHKNGYKGYVIRGDFGHQSVQERLWGGTATENICQRMSRDLMAEGILRCEDSGLPVLYSVHDELILEVDRDSKEEAKVEAIRLLIQAPEWAPDLPLAVDGGFAECYTKLD